MQSRTGLVKRIHFAQIPAMNLTSLPEHLMFPELDRRLPEVDKVVDRSGQRFPHFEVLGFVGFLGRFAAFLCRCDCGQEFVAVGATLHRRKTCGRCRGEAKAERAAWHAMRARWGSLIAKAWRDFDCFYASMGNRPSAKHVVVRIDRRKKFGPGNCRWSTEREPQRGGREISFRGETKSISEWARQIGISRQALWLRLQRNTIANALEA